MVGSTVIALSGKVFDTLVTELLKLVGVPANVIEPISGVLSTILAGVAAALFMYAMDRLDILVSNMSSAQSESKRYLMLVLQILKLRKKPWMMRRLKSWQKRKRSF